MPHVLKDAGRCPQCGEPLRLITTTSIPVTTAGPLIPDAGKHDIVQCAGGHAFSRQGDGLIAFSSNLA